MRTLLLWLLAGAAGCTQRIDLLASNSATSCATSGASIPLGPGVPCAAALAEKIFSHALCACSDLTLPGGLYTHGQPMIPPVGPMMPPGSGVASDGSVAASGAVQLFGGLDAAGANGVQLGGAATVLGDLHSGGPVGTTQLLTVGGDLFARGNLDGRIDVNGDIHVVPSAVVGPSVAGRMIVREPVVVLPQCGCGGGPALDVAALAHARADANDNAAIGLAATAFARSGAATALDLPCGAYYLSALASNAALTLRVHGRAVLFVDGDVTLGNLQAMLDAGAELDLLVAGSLSVAALGASTPSSMRVWVGGSSLRIGSGMLGALLYAPTAVLSTDGSGGLTTMGALFVKGLNVSGDVDVRFDRKIPPPAPTCL
jgi:hypothetical protein